MPTCGGSCCVCAAAQELRHGSPLFPHDDRGGGGDNPKLTHTRRRRMSGQRIRVPSGPRSGTKEIGGSARRAWACLGWLLVGCACACCACGSCGRRAEDAPGARVVRVCASLRMLFGACLRVAAHAWRCACVPIPLRAQGCAHAYACPVPMRLRVWRVPTMCPPTCVRVWATLGPGGTLTTSTQDDPHGARHARPRLAECHHSHPHRPGALPVPKYRLCTLMVPMP